MRLHHFLSLTAVVVLVLQLFFTPVSAQKRTTALPTADTAAINNLLVEGTKLAKNMDGKASASLAQVISLCENKTSPYHIRQHHQALAALGGYYTFKGSHDSAAYIYTKLMKSSEAHNDRAGMAKANIGFGLIADYQADYEKAIHHNMQALSYMESVHDTTGIAAISGNMANSYIRIKQYQKAVDLLNHSIALYLKKGMTRQAGNNISSLARAYKGLGNRPKELELKLKAYNIFKAEGYKKGMATVAINLGVFYEGDAKYSEALRYYNVALKNSRDIKDRGNIAILFNNLSDLYLKLNKTDTARLYNDSAWYYASRSGDRLSQSDALMGQANILHTLGKHAEAAGYADRYNNLRDSIYNTRMQRQVADMEVRYETAKKESQIILLNTENNIKALQLRNSFLQLNENRSKLKNQRQALLIDRLELKNKDQKLLNQRLDVEKSRQRIRTLQEQSRLQKLGLENRKLQVMQRNYAIGIILIAVTAGILLSYFYYARYRAAQETKLKLEVFKQQEIANRALFEGEQKERIRIARDLHDSIGQMLSVVKMNLSAMHHQHQSDAILQQTLNLVDTTVAEVRNVSHNLIPEELNFGLLPAIESMCDKISQAGDTQVNMHLHPESEGLCFEREEELSIYRILQEVLGNAVKHSQATQIDLDVLQQGEHITLAVKDNGQGFDINRILNSKSLGWKNISARVNLLNGQMQVQSGQQAGTQIKIIIPQ